MGWLVILLTFLTSFRIYAQCPLLLDAARQEDLKHFSVAELVRDYFAFREKEISALIPYWKSEVRYWEKMSENQEDAAEKAQRYLLYISAASEPCPEKYVREKIRAFESGSLGQVFVESLLLGQHTLDVELQKLKSVTAADTLLDQLLRKKLGFKEVAAVPQELPNLPAHKRRQANLLLEAIGGRVPHPDLLDRLRRRPLVRDENNPTVWGRVQIYRELVAHRPSFSWVDAQARAELQRDIDRFEALLAE